MTTKSKTPAILLIDLETSFNVETSFSLINQGYSRHYDNIIQERHIICASWKWLGKGNKIHSLSVADFKGFNKNPNDDFKLCEALVELVSEADAIVAHNLDRFDLPYLKTRALFHKLPPIPKIIQIDTLKLARQTFKFNSNRLDYLGKFLGVGRKSHTKSGLWLECLKGNREAIEQMVKYNRGDIRLLEDVYNILKPYVPEKINYKLFNPKANCGHCGSSKIQYRGFYYTKTKKYQRFSCSVCGAWGKENKGV